MISPTTQQILIEVNMLKTDERKELEKQVLQYSLSGINDFVELKRLGINSDSFRDNTNKRIFESVELYLKENRTVPEIDQLYSFIVATGGNTNKELAIYINDLYPYHLQNIQVLRLIEDNIEIETKKIISDNKNEFGLDYATNLNEQISNIILKYTGNIKKEKTTTEILDELIEKIVTGKQSEEYIKTGIKSLDKNIIGIPKNHITVIGAATGQGKTTFAMQLQRNFVEQGLKVGIFSLEMSSNDLLIKNISAVTEINSIDIENNRLSENDKERIKKVNLKTENLIISESGYQTPQHIKTVINQWKIQEKIDVIIIDYLTLIKTKIKNERYDLVIGELSNDLRIFAKETGIPIIILSQLNRGYSSRPFSRPSLTDLRESGQIEQNAKLILLLYYPHKYHVDVNEERYKRESGFDIKEYRDKNGDEISRENYYNVKIVKARSGRTGDIHLKYLPQFHKFEEIFEVVEDYNSLDF